MTPESASFCLQAVDPGDRHCGVAKFRVLSPSAPTNRSGAWQAVCETATEYDPPGLVALMESAAWPDPVPEELRPEPIAVYVVEEFRLYPWMAREQGYSDFKTARLIGKLEYLAQRAARPLFLQGASVKKPAVAKAERYAQDLAAPGFGPELVKLTSGRYDFKGRNQHVRDAIAHGWYWLLTNPHSPLCQSGGATC